MFDCSIVDDGYAYDTGNVWIINCRHAYCLMCNIKHVKINLWLWLLFNMFMFI